MSRYQKGKTNLDFTEARDSLHLAPDRQPHQHPTTVFFQAGCPSCRPTNRVKAPKARQTKKSYKIKWNYAQCNSADNFISKAKAHPRMLSMADTSKLRLKLITTSLHIHVCTSIIDTGCYNLNAKFNVYLYKNQKRQIHRFVVGRPPDLASLDTCPQRCCSLGRCGQHHWQTGKLESSHQQRHVAELCTVQTSSNAYTLLLLPCKNDTKFLMEILQQQNDSTSVRNKAPRSWKMTS